MKSKSKKMKQLRLALGQRNYFIKKNITHCQMKEKQNSFFVQLEEEQSCKTGPDLQKV